MTQKPVIGVTTQRHTTKSGRLQIFIAEDYLTSVSNAGGIPLMIPLGLDNDQLDGIFPLLDGLLLTGGGDVDPQSYGVQTQSQLMFVDPDRDRVEIHLAQKAVDAGLPFFGVCRGHQVVNVALGGTLYTDIADEYPNALQHRFSGKWARDHLAHRVQIDPQSRLARILGTDQPQVNSIHHQAIRELASGLVETAHAPDGIIEGTILPGHPFGLTVQWHPENLQAYESMRALFRTFVGAASI
ncbi:MAG: gamma-glutamyl-gamma-aminobutyrate hydrolase family protein [Anaerolineae bacterium]|nr:gamma-glutamyl-gamma-aminobutyrate hydrolase family protein [Anaerolineae bacterium]